MNQEAAEFWTRALQALQTANHTAASDPDAAASRAYYAAFYGVSALFASEEEAFTAIHTAQRILSAVQETATELKPRLNQEN